jgi:hypothetical protein
MAAGILTVVLLNRSSDQLQVRNVVGVQEAQANSAKGGPRVVSERDPRIKWISLDAAAISPLYADGEQVLFVTTRGEEPVATLYRYSPSLVTIDEVAHFVPRGPLAGIAVMADAVIIAHGEFITILGNDGSVRPVQLPARERAAVGVEGQTTSRDLPQNIRGILAVGNTIYATRFDVQGVEELSINGESAGIRLLGLPSSLAPPVGLATLPTGRLLVSSPFDFYNLRGGAAILDPQTGAANLIDGRPYSIALSNGSVVATQTSMTALFVLDAEERPVTVGTQLPLTGREDQLGVHGDVLAVAPEQAGAIFVSRAAMAVDRFALPILQGEPSQPWQEGSTASVRPSPVRFTSTVPSITVTSDSYVVFVSAGPTLQLGTVSVR